MNCTRPLESPSEARSGASAGSSSRPAGRNSASTACPDLTALATCRTGPSMASKSSVGKVARTEACPPPAETALAKARLGDPAIGRLRDELGEITLALRQGERDDARHVASGEEAQADRRRCRRPSRRWKRRSSARRLGARPARRPTPPAANSGPMISSAPSCSALSAARRAPSAVPLVSLGIER